MSALYPLLAAAAAAAIAYYTLRMVIFRLSGPTRALAQFNQPLRTQSQASAVGSRPFKIGLFFRKAGLDVSGREQQALAAAVVVLGLPLAVPLAWLEMPLLTWLAGPLMAYLILTGMYEGGWTRYQREVEKEIPLMLMRLAGMLQATTDSLQALAEVADSLDPHKPLGPWLRGLTQAVQRRGIPALDPLEAEARVISPGLLLVVLEIRRLYETGGQGYAAAFQLAAEHLSSLLATRALAYAKAGGSWGTARIVIFGAALSLGFIILNPTSKALFLSNPLTQLGLIGLVIWGGVGWKVINEWVKEAVQ